MHRLVLAPLLLLTAAAPPQEGDKHFMVTGFDRVRVDGPYVVEIVSGSPDASVSGDPRAIAHVVVRVDGSTLIINSGTIGWELRTAEAPGAVKVRVAMPILRGLAVRGGGQVMVAEAKAARIDLGLNGGGSIAVAALKADDLYVTLTGPGTITLAGSAARVQLRSFGEGAVLADGLVTGDALVTAESSGETRLTATYSAQVSARGSGKVTVLGKPLCRTAGTGPIECGTR